MEISENELYGLDDEVPGTKQHNLNWEKIWPRITFKYINFQERDVIFKGGGSQVDFFRKIFPRL